MNNVIAGDAAVHRALGGRLYEGFVYNSYGEV